ncbi:putative disease resistance protein At1g50180 [Magnolia sinica]|uniref:putative disease resistance protein At1g50180 n=1 Tax=Magnolia sinica TaxID=86752 RepID=UPI00265B0556|nr:putative disease resistance protein At1g50180 [Magnolia sinica]
MVAVEAVVSQLLKKLADPLISLYDVDDKVELLVIQFRVMQCFLKDADARQERNEGVKNWVLNVRDAAYEAEDVIDNFIYKVARLKRTGFMGCITRYACIFCELIARYKLSSDIERINNKFRVISESRSALRIKDISQEAAGTSSAGPSLQEWRLTSPLSQEPDFVGFENDLEILVDRLTNGELRRRVVSVVGMGGLGKTTLTKKVYNDSRVKAHFQSFAWISVSQEFGLRDLLLDFINCYMELSKEELKRVKKMNVSQLRNKISEYLEGKKYLMVVDDIWSNEAWDALKDAFPDVSNGSRIMLTTRNKDTALHADAASRPHHLRFLNNEESWKLFCKKVFLGGDGSCPQQFETLGREIVENCYGLPLAIIVIGGLLSRKEPWEWENVPKSIHWQLSTEKHPVYEILSLSYKDLPYYLKSCFLYLGSFPEDYEFQTKDLIRLWTAEGLLEERGEETFEEVGEDYLQELVRRSLVQVTSRRSSGRIKSCRVHDLLRDLSIAKAREGKFLEVHRGNVNNRPASGARRLAIHNNDLRTLEKLPESREFSTYLSKLTLALSFLDQDPMATLEKLENLRILRLFGNAYWGKEMACTAKGFPRLEFLHLEELGQLEEWKVAKGALPSLLRLRIFNCQFLKMLPEGLQHVTTLQKLQLQVMPVEFNKRLRKGKGEDWHKIRHIPSININEWRDCDDPHLRRDEMDVENGGTGVYFP